MSRKGLLALLFVVALVAAFLVFGLGRYLTLDYLQSIRGDAVAWVTARPVLASLGFLLAYVLVTGLSLPGAAIMTLASGAIFGLPWGHGAGVLRELDWGDHRVCRVSQRVGRLGAVALCHGSSPASTRDSSETATSFCSALRMVPLLPFFIINLVMGLTPMRVAPFYLVSQVGMLPATFVFVFAGTQLADVREVSDVLSPGLIAAMSLLGVFPLLARKAMAFTNRRRHDKAAATTASNPKS